MLRGMHPPQPKLKTSTGSILRLDYCVLRVRCAAGPAKTPLVHKLPLLPNEEDEFNVLEDNGMMKIFFEIISIFDDSKVSHLASTTSVASGRFRST